MWQGAGFYHFTSCNQADGNPNYTANVNYPGDIEGLWTYVYYSHSRVVKRSVGFIQFGPAGTPQRIQHDVTHPTISYLKFVLAGAQFSYPGVNGIFLKVVYKIGPGAFLDTIDNYNQFYATQAPAPSVISNKTVTIPQIGDPANINNG